LGYDPRNRRHLTIRSGSSLGIIYEIIIVKGDVAEGLVFLAFILGIIVFALLMLYRESFAQSIQTAVSRTDIFTTSGHGKTLARALLRTNSKRDGKNDRTVNG